MAKLTLTDSVNLQNESSFITSNSANNARIEAALENTLSRDGTAPNTMGADLDMNSNPIINLPAPTQPTEPVRLQDLEDFIADLGDLSDGLAAPISANYLVSSASASLTNDRVVGDTPTVTWDYSVAGNAKAYADASVTYAQIKLLDTDLTTYVHVSDRGSQNGTFVWSAEDHSADVSRDSAEAYFIPPTSDPTGASGAWLRFPQTETVRVEHFVPDLTASGAINTALDLALAFLTRPCKIIIPAGIYTWTAPVFIPTEYDGSPLFGVEIVCEGKGFATRFDAAAGLTGTVFVTATGTLQHFRWEGGLFRGNSFATHAFAFEECIHSTFDDIIIAGTTVYGLRANNGYSNTFNNLRIFTNTGGGIDISGVNINNVTLNDCRIFANDGLGVLIGAGLGIVINNCGIEGCKQGGLLAYNVRGLTFNGGYFERNAEDGYAYTIANGSPENITIKADIHLLCDGRRISYDDPTAACIGVDIKGCMFAPYGSLGFPPAAPIQDCCVFATSMDNLRITNCDILDPAQVTAMVGTYNIKGEANVTSLVLEQNTYNTIVGLQTLPGTTLDTIHKVSNRDIPNTINYASQTFSNYTAASGTTGSIADNGTFFGPNEVWVINPGDRIWNYSISLTDHPELRGKAVWFGINYRIIANNDGLQLFCGGISENDGTEVESATPGGDWLTKSVFLESVSLTDPTLNIAFTMIGNNGTILINSPRCCIVGVNHTDALRSPAVE